MKKNIDLDTARALIKQHDGYGNVRVYGVFLDGVYKNQIASVKSENQLDELTSAYRMQLYVMRTDTSPANVSIVRMS